MARAPAKSKSEPATAPRPRDAIRTKARILECAFDEFARHGYDGARVDRIVKTAGVNISLVYQYFGSKEKIFIAVMEQAYDLMRASHRDFDVRDLEPEAAMESLLRRTFHIFIDHPELISLLNSENVHSGRHIAKSEHIRVLYNPLLDTIRMVLDRGAAAGVFRPDVDAEALFISMNGMGYFYLSNRFTLGVILGRDLMTRKSLARHEDHIVSVMLGYLKA
ncbi:MAG: TetR family transcriptional regulator [Variovorax sp.]